MRVSARTGTDGQAGKTRLEIDYSGFRYAFGGDYGYRLRMVKLEECALTAPRPAARSRSR